MQITAGDILIETGTAVPEAGLLAGKPYSRNWTVPNVVRRGLEERLGKAGWTLFFMAGVIKARAFGFDEKKRERAAIGRVLKRVHSQQCNCVEITRVANRSFLGIPYLTVFAHSRHIQDNCRFQSERYPEEQGVTGDQGTGVWEDEGGASRNQPLPYGRGSERASEPRP